MSRPHICWLSQLKGHPRTSEGGFWHKKIYPFQMWLDGLYMSSPFLAEYAKTFGREELFDDVANQLLLVEKHTRDPKTGLLHHGWDESREQAWCDSDDRTILSFLEPGDGVVCDGGRRCVGALSCRSP